MDPMTANTRGTSFMGKPRNDFNDLLCDRIVLKSAERLLFDMTNSLSCKMELICDIY